MTAGAWRVPASALAALFAAGDSNPVEHLQLLRERIARLDPKINALIHVSPRADEEARASAERWRRGAARGPLDGVPVAVKDNILVAGMPTTWGARGFKDQVPDTDERPVDRLRQAGAVILGKTNVPEFTLEGYTSNPLFGTTRNPWDLALTPGGSSGGAVAGVAAGLFPLALGTDGGGSIRRPASHTGLVGMKPSIGRVPRFPSLPQILLDFEVIGPIARSVADAALLYRAIDGPAPSALQPPAPLTILYVPRFGGSPLDPEIAASIDEAAAVFTTLGHSVERGELPFDLEPIVEFWPLLGQVGLAHLFDLFPRAESLASAKFAEMARLGRAVPAKRYLAGQEAIRVFRHRVREAFANFDLVLTPSAAALPWAAEEVYPPLIDGREAGPRGHAVYTGWVNACGHPAISVPCAPSASGMPIGLQLVADFGEDELLFRIAAQFETARPFAQRWPALAEIDEPVRA